MITVTVIALGRMRRTAPSRIWLRQAAHVSVKPSLARRASHACSAGRSITTPNSAATPGRARWNSTAVAIET